MIAVLLGAPGSGKGTQARALSARYGLKHLATGDIFRGEIAERTALGLKAEGYVKSGRLVPDDLVTEMVAARLNTRGSDCLLDGFPRNLDQAQSLASILAQEDAAVGLVAFLKISEAAALKRLVSRRVCSGCGEVYNTETRPAPAGDQCGRCGKNVVLREDDAEPTARKRLMVFEDLTRPMISYYKSEAVFHEIDAGRAVEDVEADLSALVASALSARIAR